MDTDPPKTHVKVQDEDKAGIAPKSVVEAPGAQGAGKTPKQGIGVSTPIAAAVALATVGFKSELHVPKGPTLTTGAKS